MHMKRLSKKSDPLQIYGIMNSFQSVTCYKGYVGMQQPQKVCCSLVNKLHHLLSFQLHISVAAALPKASQAKAVHLSWARKAKLH